MNKEMDGDETYFIGVSHRAAGTRCGNLSLFHYTDRGQGKMK